MLKPSLFSRLPASSATWIKPTQAVRYSIASRHSSLLCSRLQPQHQTIFQPRQLSTTRCLSQSSPTTSDPEGPHEKVISSTHSPPPSKALPHKPAPHRNPDEPIYQLTFTCKPCRERSSHTISKQGYHHGTVLIKCPNCHNRHLISDHLHIFSDQKVTLEDIMKDKGESVQRGSINMEGDVEFWGEDAVAVGESAADAETASAQNKP